MTKYDQKVSLQQPNPYLDFLINTSFQGVNILFVLSLENKNDITVYTKYHVSTIEIKDKMLWSMDQTFLYTN